MDRFEALNTFIVIVQCGGISAAADRLNIAKSAVSRRLHDLELRLGARLLNRTTRSQSLTPAGQALFERAQAVLADLDEAEAAVSCGQQVLYGTLRVAAPLSFGVMHLAPLTAEFLLAHPDLQLDLDVNDRQVDVVHEGFDMAIRIGELPDSSLIARRLTTIDFVCAASPEYLRRRGTPRHPDELSGHDSVQYSLVRRSRAWRFRGPDGREVTPEARCRVRVSNGEFMLTAAQRGLGVVVQPRFIAYQALRDGSLVEILNDFSLGEVGLYAVFPPGRYLSHRVRTFADFLGRRFRQQLPWVTAS